MAGTREEAKRRSEARSKRRSPEVDSSQDSTGSAREGDSDALDSAKHAIGVAVVGALAAGLGGAAKTMLERRSRERSDERAPASEEAPTSEEPDDAQGRDSDAQPEDTAEVPTGEMDATDDDEEADRPPTRAQPEGRSPERGASRSDVAHIVERARGHVEELLGSAPESVSGLEHVDGTWYVTLEVVELRRIPDSTDVLSSYEVVLDGDGDLIRIERRRRYRRAQVEEG